MFLVSPPIAHHPRADPARWRTMLGAAGLDIVEEGTTPGSRHFLAGAPHATADIER
jgi:hypothetical protein